MNESGNPEPALFGLGVEKRPHFPRYSFEKPLRSSFFLPFLANSASVFAYIKEQVISDPLF